MSLAPEQAARAKALYFDFFEKYRETNPTDLSTEAKYEHAFEIGFDDFRLMLNARKESHDFTLFKTWLRIKNAEAKAAHEAAKVEQCHEQAY